MIVRLLYSRKKDGITLGSKLIMWALGSSASHCATELVFDGESGEVYEAVYPKFRVIDKEEWLKKNLLIHSFEFEITDPILADKIQRTLFQKLNVPYSFVQLILIGIGLFFKLVVRFFETFCLNSDKYEICSEAQSDVIELLGYKFDQNPDNIDVKECLDAAKRLKGIL